MLPRVARKPSASRRLHAAMRFPVSSEHRPKIVGAPLLSHIRPKGKRNYYIITIETKFGRSHADNHVVFAIEFDRPSQDVAVAAKALPPKMKRQDCNLVVTIGPFFSRKRTTDSGVHTENSEEVRRDKKRIQALGIAAAGERKGPAGGRGHTGKRLGLRAPVEKIWGRRRKLEKTFAGILVKDVNQATGIRKRQGPQQDRVDHAEHRG